MELFAYILKREMCKSAMLSHMFEERLFLAARYFAYIRCFFWVPACFSRKIKIEKNLHLHISTHHLEAITALPLMLFWLHYRSVVFH